MRQKQPRLYDAGFLAWLRKRRCIACSKPPPCDAAHIRVASLSDGKPETGMGRKPDDKWAVPLCRSCHASQHAAGDELKWWSSRARNPFFLAKAFYAQYGGAGGTPRKRATIKPRLPREQRAKIQSRNSFR